MTNKYDNVYINDSYSIAGMYESDGPLKKYFDRLYDDDMYFGEKSFEKAEIKMLRDCISCLLEVSKKKDKDIDLIISGDLQNQLASSDYAIRNFDIPYLGIYSACATFGEGLIVGSSFIDSKKYNNLIVSTSSHNMVAEKQFRNPTEYGAPKPDYSTFTSTGAVSLLLSNKKSKIKITSGTIGKVCDANIKDVNNMGGIMAISAIDTIRRHLSNLKIEANYYDLILTGDLGKYGKEIVIDYFNSLGIDLTKNYDDCGCILYDLENQPVFAGGSGPACSALVTFSYIIKQMKEGKLKKVLYVPTGAIFSPTMFYQRDTIPSIAHAISLEVV